jgi:hypothetical protein
MIEAKVFRTFIRIYSLFKCERLTANIKLTLHKSLFTACPTLELAADTCLLKLQPMQNKNLSTSGPFPRCSPFRDSQTALNLPYVHDCITKFCRREIEVIQIHQNEHDLSMQQGEARHRKYKKLKLRGGQAYDLSNV